MSALSGSLTPSHGPLFASSDVNIDVDLSFVVQIVLFAFFVLIMKPILFEPLMKVFEEREKRTGGARGEAREMDEKAGALVKRFDDEIEKVRQAANKERDKLRAESAALEAEILANAKQQSNAIIESGRARIREEIAQLRADLDAARPALAEQIASKVLGREVQS
ncbi:MAG: ATP synthase F0 subunit B [Polyangiaceae bacterium]